jgi:hypothetical protein
MQQQDQSEQTVIAEEQELAQESIEDISERDEDISEQIKDEADKTSINVDDLDNSAKDDKKSRFGFDWLAIGIVLPIAALFSLTARFNSQPAPSFIPIVALSATGCGLLVTALRKLRTSKGVGLWEAGLCGFFLGLFQFAVALTYPEVFTTILTVPPDGHAFLLTWGLVGLFSVVLSLAGATLGHLIFAPARPLPERAERSVQADDLEKDEEEADTSVEFAMSMESKTDGQSANAEVLKEKADLEGLEDLEEEAEIIENIGMQIEIATSVKNTIASKPDDALDVPSAIREIEDEEAKEEKREINEVDLTEEERETEEEQKEQERDAETEENEEEQEEGLVVATAGAQPRGLFLNYAISIMLLGLLPMIVGYVFAAAYDYILGLIHVDQISPGLYPTLSLLGGLLPWRLQAPIILSGANGSFIVFTLLWRIPDSFLGNPNVFDVQTLEPLFFNAAALSLLLITMYGRESHDSKLRAAPWGVFIFLELLLGLALLLAPDLWMLRGLEGILQFRGVAIPLPTVHFLNTTLFILNLVTGPLFCLLVGLVVRRQYYLWTLPRLEKTALSDT